MTVDQAEIARRTGFSQQTISLALNHPQKLRPETLAKINAVLEETGYVPNQFARNFKQGRSSNIGLVFRILSDHTYMRPFLALTLKGLHEEAAALGYGVWFHAIKETDEIEPFLRSRSLDGVIVGTYNSLTDLPLFKSLQNRGHSFVVYSYNQDLPGVEIDLVEGFYRGTKRLLAAGRTQIAYLGGGLDQEFNMKKFHGFKKAMDEAKIPIISDLIRHDCWSMDHGAQAVETFLKKNLTFDGIFAAEGDFLALGVLNELKRAGLQVPNQISLLSGEGSLHTHSSDPILSSLVAPYEERARQSVRMLADILTKGKGERYRLLPMSFQEGGTL